MSPPQALLFSRAARLAIDELSEGRMAPEPFKPKDFDLALTEEKVGIQDDKPPTWQQRACDWCLFYSCSFSFFGAFA